MRATQNERRRHARRRTSRPIWWSAQERDRSRFVGGWLVERSVEGAAFLTRGRRPPLPGAEVYTSDHDPDFGDSAVVDAQVRRVSRVHDDLYLVAVRYQQPIEQP